MIKRALVTSEVTKLTFVLPIEAAPSCVSVVGEFNGWDPLAHPLKKRSNGTRSVSMEVPAGTSYQFMYLADDATWFCDPDADAHVPNAFGDSNGVVAA
jgi:1,4-alpha-glucan branching enzyme